MSPRIGALFAGYGGLDIAATDVFGGDMAWYSEVDKGALKILGHRFPDVPNVGDVTAVDWSQVEPVDILTGGSPCQDLSHAGKRQGMTEGTRSNLWVAMREAIAQLRPSTVVWENVRGAFSAAADSAVEPCPGCVGDGSGVHLRALGRVLGDLSDLGYDCRWHGLRAADVGAPHGRFRVFVVATDATGNQGRLAHGDGGVAADTGRVQRREGWAAGPSEAEGGRSFGDAGGRDLDTLKTLPTPSARDWKDHTIRREPHRPDDTDTLARALTDVPCALLPTPAVNDMGAGKTVEDWDAWTDRMKAEHGNGNGHGKSLAIEAQRLLPTPRASDGTKGGPNQRGSSGDLMLPAAVQPGRLLATPRAFGSRTSRHAASTAYRRSAPSLEQQVEIAEGITPREIAEAADVQDSWRAQWGDYAAAIARWEHILGRPAPAPTMTSAKGNPQLSPVFVEWLMGLPAGWVTDVPSVTRNEALKALGNGVVPQQAAAAIRTMLAWAVAA